MSSPRGLSPHPGAVLIPQRRARLAMECLLKLRHVRNPSISAIFSRGMRIDCGAQALAFIASQAAPALPISYKEALLRRESIQRLQALASGGILPCQICEKHSAGIGNGVTQRQLAVNFDV